MCFFDVPVYRIKEDAYYDARKAYVDKHVYQVGSTQEAFFRASEQRNPHAHTSIREHLQTKYGGLWQFNEIIGYIRLHFVGTQVRGEYFGPKQRRVAKTRTRTFEWQTHKLAPEVDIEPPYGRAEILRAIRAYIDACRRELPRRYVDSSGFEVIAPHVEWENLFAAS